MHITSFFPVAFNFPETFFLTNLYATNWADAMSLKFHPWNYRCIFEYRMVSNAPCPFAFLSSTEVNNFLRKIVIIEFFNDLFLNKFWSIGIDRHLTQVFGKKFRLLILVNNFRETVDWEKCFEIHLEVWSWSVVFITQWQTHDRTRIFILKYIYI